MNSSHSGLNTVTRRFKKNNAPVKDNVFTIQSSRNVCVVNIFLFYEGALLGSFRLLIKNIDLKKEKYKTDQSGN